MTPLTLPSARALSVRPMPLGTATTWTPTGARDGLSAPLGTYLEHASAADAAAHVVRHPGARILSCTEPLSAADHERLLIDAREALAHQRNDVWFDAVGLRK